MCSLRSPHALLSLSALLVLAVAFGACDEGSTDTQTSENECPSFSVETEPDSPWGTLADMHTARASGASAVYDCKLYVFGGSNGSGVLDSVEEYDPQTDSWTTRAPMLTPRTGHVAATINGKMYVVGGQDGTGTKIDAVEEYDPEQSFWTNCGTPSPGNGCAPMMVTGTGFAFAVVDDRLYLMGGGQVPTKTTQRYDPVTNSWKQMASMITGRNDYPAAAVVDREILVLGGFGAKTKAEAYSPDSDTWSALPDLPRQKWIAFSAVLGGKVYVFGPRAQVEEYDPGSEHWTRKTSRPFLSDLEAPLGASRINGVVFLPGGAYNSGTKRTRTLAFYVPDLD